MRLVRSPTVTVVKPWWMRARKYRGISLRSCTFCACPSRGQFRAESGDHPQFPHVIVDSPAQAGAVPVVQRLVQLVRERVQLRLHQL